MPLLKAVVLRLPDEEAATKALESTVKCICAERGWTHPRTATASTLLDVLVNNGFMPRKGFRRRGAAS